MWAYKVLKGVKVGILLGVSVIVNGAISNSRKDREDGTIVKVLVGAGALAISGYVCSKIDGYLDEQIEIIIKG